MNSLIFMITISQLKQKIFDKNTPITPQTRSSVNSPTSKSMLYHSNQKLSLLAIKETQQIDQMEFQIQTKDLKEQLISSHTSNTFVTGFDSLINSHGQQKFIKIKERQKQTKITAQAALVNLLFPLDQEILEVYSNYEKNYKSINQLEHSEPVKIQFACNVTQSKIEGIDKYVQTFDGLKQSELNNETKNLIKIESFRFYYFRTKIQGRQSPLYIFFNYPDKVQSSNLKIYISTHAEFPTKFNADSQIQAKYTKVYSSQNLATFQEKFLFITIYAEIEFELNIELIFGNPIQKRQSKPVIVEDEGPQPKRVYSLRTPQKDKIAQNLETLQYQSTEKLRKLLHSSQTRHRMQKRVLFQKKDILESRQAEKVLKLQAKEQIRQYRAIERRYQSEIANEKELQLVWFKIMALIQIVQTIEQNVTEYKRRQQVQAKGKLLVWKLKMKELINVKKYGKSPKERTIFKSRLCVTIFAYNIKKKVKSKSKLIIQNFMQQILLTLTILNKYQSVLKKIIRIQRKFRKLKIKKQQYKDKFWKMVREKYVEYQQIKRQQNLFVEEKKQSHISIDIPTMQKIMDEYTQKKRQELTLYVNETILSKKEFKKKILDMATHLKEPKVYQLPSEVETIEIINKYIKQKQNN